MTPIAIRTVIIIFSMALIVGTVKAQDRSSTFVRNVKISSGVPEQNNSVKGAEGQISTLVQILMTSGRDGKYVNGHAQAVGLDSPMPIKGTMVPIGTEARKCQIIYRADEASGNTPILVYLLRAKKTTRNVQERFYRVSLNGQLEKAITLRNKLDDNGKVLREGRSRVEEDMSSPEIKTAFNEELSFWLNDWLKKRQQDKAKKEPATAAKPGKKDSKTAEPAKAAP